MVSKISALVIVAFGAYGTYEFAVYLTYLGLSLSFDDAISLKMGVILGVKLFCSNFLAAFELEATETYSEVFFERGSKVSWTEMSCGTLTD
jgi:hypothetical protein